MSVRGTAAQRHVMRQLRDDLRAFSIEIPVPMRFTTKGLAPDDQAAYFYELLTEDPHIALHPSLQGGLLYNIALHELGHVFGLGHTRRGIMKADGGRPRNLSTRNRRRWLRELFDQLLRKRLQEI